MPTTADYLNNLLAQRDNLVDNLVAKGVTASKTELLDTLVPKVLDIEDGSGKAKLNIFTQMTEPEGKEGIWLKTSDPYIDIVTDSNVWTAGSWTAGGAAIPYNFIDGSAVSIGTDVYLFGGYSTGTQKYCYKYNTSNNTYTKMTDIPYEFTNGSAVSIGTDVYLFGGNSTGTGTQKYCYKYNTLNDTYTKMTDIPYDFYRGSAVSIGTGVYLFGGAPYRTNCYKYNTLNNTYAKMTSIPYEFYGGSAVSIQDNIYILGCFSFPTSNQIYNLAAKQFENNSFVIERVSEYYGKYFTQLQSITASNFTPAKFGRITSGFDNAWIYKNSDLQELPSYYGNGTAWVKFKN